MILLTLTYSNYLFNVLICYPNLLIYSPTFYQTVKTKLSLIMDLLIPTQLKMALTKEKLSHLSFGESITILLFTKSPHNLQDILYPPLGKLVYNLELANTFKPQPQY